MSKVYHAICGIFDKFVPSKLRPLWEHPAGPKTVFFWAPAFKWGLVMAGIGDLNRPPENLSISQTTTLMITGFIWSRYSMVIIPINYSLFSVNFFMALVQLRQTVRCLMYQQSLKQKEAPEKNDPKKK